MEIASKQCLLACRVCVVALDCTSVDACALEETRFDKAVMLAAKDSGA